MGNLSKEMELSFYNCLIHLEENPKSNFEIEGLNFNDAIELKNKYFGYFGDYNLKIIRHLDLDPSTVSPAIYQLNSSLIISKK